MTRPRPLARTRRWLLAFLGGLQARDVGCRVAHVGERVVAAHRCLGRAERLVGIRAWVDEEAVPPLPMPVPVLPANWSSWIALSCDPLTSSRPPWRSVRYPVGVFCPFNVMQIGPPPSALLFPRFTFQALSRTSAPVSSALADAWSMVTSWVFCRYTPTRCRSRRCCRSGSSGRQRRHRCSGRRSSPRTGRRHCVAPARQRSPSACCSTA